VYGPVRTVVWQGSVGDHRPYADHCPLKRLKHERFSSSGPGRRLAETEGACPRQRLFPDYKTCVQSGRMVKKLKRPCGQSKIGSRYDEQEVGATAGVRYGFR
jgi:hypothetical protein